MNTSRNKSLKETAATSEEHMEFYEELKRNDLIWMGASDFQEDT